MRPGEWEVSMANNIARHERSSLKPSLFVLVLT